MNQEYHRLLSDSTFIQQLLESDGEAGEELRGLGCTRTPGCGGKLDRAYYTRRPRGLKVGLSVVSRRRVSFCCRNCRKRHTPESVLFLYRKVYVFLAVFIGLDLRSGSMVEVTLRQVRRVCGASEVTVRRWKKWVTQFLQSAVWRELRSKLCATFRVEGFPRSLFEEFLKSAPTRGEVVSKALCFLSVLSIRMIV